MSLMASTGHPRWTSPWAPVARKECPEMRSDPSPGGFNCYNAAGVSFLCRALRAGSGAPLAPPGASDVGAALRFGRQPDLSPSRRRLDSVPNLRETPQRRCWAAGAPRPILRFFAARLRLAYRPGRAFYKCRAACELFWPIALSASNLLTLPPFRSTAGRYFALNSVLFAWFL